MDVTGKRLLILGAGRGQLGLYRAAREMGIHTIAGTLPGNNLPCLPLADEVCHMNIANPQEVLEKARELRLDGAATCCLDTGIAALGLVCDTLGLNGLGAEAAARCNDKLRMKQALMKNGVSTARFLRISTEEELSSALEELRMPVILKATDLQGSRGIYISRTREEAFAGFREAMSLTRRSYCIVEEFIEGTEFGAQAFVSRGEVFFVMPHGDETFMSHTAVPVGHYVPLNGSADILRQTDEVVRKAIAALGLDNCAVNVDLIEKDGVVYIIELTGRVGANCLPELVEINFGVEYYKMIAAMALGENPRALFDRRRSEHPAGLARMFFSTDRAGTLEKIRYAGPADPDVLEITFFKHPGDEIRVFENSNDCIGQVIVRGADAADCDRKMRAVFSQIEMTLA